MQTFIDLSRRFRDLTKSELEEPELLASLNNSEYLSADAWSEILKYPRVLILAEAGSGKTTEMSEQAKRLSIEKKYAFFVALESLDKENITNLLSVEDERRFETWKTDGYSLAWFFFDAVDELKLTRGKLERALGRFAKSVDGLLDRTHIVISCRPNDWRPVLDMAIVEAKLPIIHTQSTVTIVPDEVFLQALRKEEGVQQPEKSKIDESKVRTVIMLPMSERQIETFSLGLGVVDTVDFIAEIHKQNAWMFARRPLDCSELIAAWKATKKLGTRAQQHEANITAKLKDDPDRADSGVLPDAKARLGAERLALALTLTRTRTIRSPEQSLDTDRAEGVLDPTEILRDWTEEERQTLLRRALFDPATYGRVRFHHQSVQEYLAACRLKSLRDVGMSVKALMVFLFAERYGVDVVIPSMQAIAAWLALWNEDVLRELMKREPEILLSQGDPESLSLEAKSGILRAFAAAYGTGGWRGFNVPIDEVRRLADPELSGVIHDIWGVDPTNEDVRELLLELIWQGRIEQCADIAVSAANSVKLPPYHRITSVRALIACDHLKMVREIADSILAEQDKWPDKVVHDLAIDLFPTIITVNELVTLAERTPEPKKTVGGFSWGLQQITQTIDPLSEKSITLRNALADLIWRGRLSKQDQYRIRGRYDYIALSLALLCERQLSSEVQEYCGEDLVRACVVANRFGDGETGRSKPLANLKMHFTKNLFMRKMAFWIEVELMDELLTDNDPLERLHNATYESVIGYISENDRFWLEEELVNLTSQQNRAVVLQALIQIWSQRGRSVAEANLLRKSVADDSDLSEEVNKLTAPLERNIKLEKMERDRRRRKIIQEGRERQRLDGWLKWRKDLLTDQEACFSSDNISNTFNNIYQWLKAHEGRNNRYSIWNLDALTQAFGSEIAMRAAEAFKEAWRLNVPTLWSLRAPEERNSILWFWSYGLSGITAEAESLGWAKNLTPEEAKIAVAYATVELNGFPPWLVDLVDAYPKEVETVLGVELTTELGMSSEYQHLPILQDLTHADTKVKKLFAPRLLAALQEWNEEFMDEDAALRSIYHLDQVINILAGVSNDESRVAIASQCNLRFTADPDGQLALTWLMGLFYFDPEHGVQAFENGLSIIDESGRSEYAIKAFAALFSRKNSVVLNIKVPSVRVMILGRLVRCAYNYVRHEDDVVHEGVYSPNTRDDAEDARNFLLSALLDTPGLEARNVILELATEPLFAHFPDRLRLLARKRAASDAEFEPLSSTDIETIEERLESPPHDRDGLFNVMIDRLDDLFHDIAHDDFTDRGTLCTIKEESEMQRTLARRLKDMARGAYIVTREDEVADQKRTDIRLAAVQGSQKAVIEIKIADNNKWSVKDFEWALRNQLVGQYLRHESSRVGCLLLTYNGTRKFWVHPDTGEHLSFLDVINYLEFVAKEIEREMDYEIRVTVYGLDLTDPILAPAHR